MISTDLKQDPDQSIGSYNTTEHSVMKIDGKKLFAVWKRMKALSTTLPKGNSILTY